MSMREETAERTARRYRVFAAECRGRSAAYERLALAVAGDAGLLAFLGPLPEPKRQPNLLFAAARYLLGAPADIGALRALAAERGAELARTMLERSTQTNEPARCATLLPALALLPQPLALLEVGASAGLTLLADRYSYDYSGHLVSGTDPEAPVLRCQPRGPVPLPARVPAVAWRAGLDLNPLEVTDDDDMRWLHCLLWPGEGDRAARLDAAIATARRLPPLVQRGDLLTGTAALARQAPRDATLVIYHSAVLAYLSPAQRAEFARTVAELGAVWLSNEAPGLLPGRAGGGLGTPGPDLGAPPHRGPGGFVLVRDGTDALAWTGSHGEWLEWLG
jgi:hypothetical protein